MFLETLRRSAWQAGRTVQILHIAGAGADHRVNDRLGVFEQLDRREDRLADRDVDVAALVDELGHLSGKDPGALLV